MTITRHRSRKRHFDVAAKRRREIEAHARGVGAGGTDDVSRWLIAWAWHNQKSKDRCGALVEAARRMGRKGLTAAQAEAILEEASLTPRQMSADALGRFLMVSYADRERLGLTTIGSYNVGQLGRAELRKLKKRLAKERQRRARGMLLRADYEAQSLSRTKPWQHLGISRRQWYRKRRSAHGTGVAPAVFLNGGPKPVPLLGSNIEGNGHPREAVLATVPYEGALRSDASRSRGDGR